MAISIKSFVKLCQDTRITPDLLSNVECVRVRFSLSQPR